MSAEVCRTKVDATASGVKMNCVIEAKNLSKTYRSGVFQKRVTNALGGIDLSIEKGELFGIIGPNGAGKTTLLNILMGLIIADTGEAWIMGEKIKANYDIHLKRKMNMCSGNPNFPWSLSVRETIKFYAMLYGVSKADYRKREEELISVLEIEKNLNTRFDELSTGNKQRVSLAKSLINDPEILLLDEPTIGLDPDISVKIRKMIMKLHTEKKKTILLTTHYMKEAEEMCGRIAFIKEGRILALGTKNELLAGTNSEDMEEAFIALAN